MIFFILSIILVFVTCYGYGVFFSNFIIGKNNSVLLDLGEKIIVGFYFLLILSIFVHFFVPLNYIVTLSILTIGIIFFIIKIIDFRQDFSFIFLIILFSSFIGLISAKGHPDLEWYHLPYMNYLKEFKIIFGIANVNDFLGYSQTWNDIASIFQIPILEYRLANILPAIFVISIVYSIFNSAYKAKEVSLKIFIFIILIFIISKYYKIYEYGGHVPPILLAYLINIYFYFLIMEEIENKKAFVFKILFFLSFLFLLKINYIFTFPIIIYLILLHKLILYQIFLDKRVLILLFFVLIIFFTKNIIVSGCFYYPIDFTCFSSNTLSWSVGNEYAKERFDLVRALAKGWSAHILLDGNVNTIFDYLKPLTEGHILNPSEYLVFFKNTWFKYWIYIGDAKKILNNFLITLFCFIVLLPTSNPTKILKIKKTQLYKYLVIFFVYFIQLILCILLTPQSIYGADVATVVFFAFVFSFVLQNINLKNKYPISGLFLLFLLSISYYEIKNFYRVYNEFNDNEISLRDPWLKIYSNKLIQDYHQNTINNITVNIKNKKNDRHEGLPDHCGNIPMICLPEDRKKCVQDIKIRSGYFIIIGNQVECIKHLKERYFY